MMKKLLISITLILIFNTVYSQKRVFKSNMQVIYSMDFKADSTVNNKTNDVLSLYIGGNQSIFQNEKKYKVDSIISSQVVFQNTSSKPMFKVNHVVFKDLNNNELTYTEIIDNINFGYKEKNPPMVWKIKPDKKMILTYECYKAETTFRGRNFIAWFTKNIPISDGPYKFSGLPGLVLEVYDDKDNFHYQLLAIINKKQDIIYNEDIHVTDRQKLINAKINLIKKITKTDIKVNPIEKI